MNDPVPTVSVTNQSVRHPISDLDLSLGLGTATDGMRCDRRTSHGRHKYNRCRRRFQKLMVLYSNMCGQAMKESIDNDVLKAARWSPVEKAANAYVDREILNKIWDQVEDRPK